MTGDHTEGSISSLPPAARLACYRQLAEESLQLATRTYDQRLRTEYLARAGKWQRLANEVESEMHHPERPQTPPVNDGKEQPRR